MTEMGFHDQHFAGDGQHSRRYSAVLVQRLLKYHDYLQQLVRRNGRDRFVSTELAVFTNCGSSQVRRDLASIGITSGHPKGYPVRPALVRLQSILGRKQVCKAVLFGAGQLGSLLAQQNWIMEAGVVLSAAFDIDPAIIGSKLYGIPVHSVAEAPSVIRQSGACLAVIAVHPEAAQSCADTAIHAGIRAVWNFTPCNLDLPASVAVRYENIATGLAELLCAISEEVCGYPGTS